MKKTGKINCLIRGTSLFFLMALMGMSNMCRAQVVQGLNAAAGIGDVRIYWSAFSSATAYTLYWGTSPNVYPGGNTITLGNVIGYVHTGVTPGQKYYYNVVASIGGSSSGKTTEVSAMPFEQFVSGGADDGFSVSGNCLMDLAGIPLPPAPQNFHVASSIGLNMLYWDPLSNAVSYTIYSSTIQGGPYSNIVGTTTNRSFVDNSVSVGTLYYYVVQANFSGGCSGGTSLETTATPFPQSVSGGSDDGFSMASNCLMDLNGSSIPPAPAGFKVAGSIGQNVLYWDPVDNAVSYSVFSSTLSGGPYNSSVGTTKNRSLVDNSVSPGIIYYYVVQANFNGGCAGGSSLEYAAEPFPQYVSGGADDGFSLNTSCLLDLGGQSVSPAPQGFHAASSIGQNILYWDAVTNAVSYTVNKSLYSGGPYNISVGTTINRSIVDASGNIGTTYYYVVQANFSGACPGGVSSEVFAAPFEQYVSGGSDDGFSIDKTCVLDLSGNNITITPKNVFVASSIGNNVIYWDAITNASSYDILRSNSSNGPFSVIGNTSLRSFIDASASPGTSYYYAVQVLFSGGGCAGGISSIVDAAPFPQYVSGGADDGFVVASSGFFKSLGINPMSSNISSGTFFGGKNLSCFNASDGSIDFSPSGGDPQSYKFVWSNGSTTEDIAGLRAGTYQVTVSDNGGHTTTNSITLTEPSLLTASLTGYVQAGGNNISCHGSSDGSIDLTPSGGSQAYQFLWSNSNTTEDISALSAGTYRVSITDVNACLLIDSITLTEPVAMKTSLSSTLFQGGYNISCHGGSNGSINLALSGGDSLSYVFLWSNGSTTKNLAGLNKGIYHVTISDASSCTISDSIQLSESSPFTTTLSASVFSGGYNIDCNGNSSGSISNIPSGGNSPYTYSWSNGSSVKDLVNISSGTYSLSLSDANGCTLNQSIILIEPNSVVSSLSSPVYVGGYQISCNGKNDGSVNLTPSGGSNTFYTYVWSTGSTTKDISSLSAGSYDVTITDANACKSIGHILLTEPSPMSSNISSPSFSGGVNISCNGKNDGSVNLTPSGGVSPYSYLWSNSSTTEDLANVSGGTYQVNIIDANACAETKSILLSEPVALGISLSSSSFSGGFNISCNGKSDGSVNLTPLGGDASTYSYSWSNGASTQNLSGLSAGSYFVSLNDANGCLATDNISLSEPSSLIAQLSSPLAYNGYSISCFGKSDGSISLNSSGGSSPYTYLWSEGSTTKNLNGISAGNYAVTITDANGCFVSNQSTLTEPLLLSSSIKLSSFIGGYQVSCYGKTDASINLSPQGGASSNYTFLWSNGATTEDLSGLAAGTYSVVINDLNGCTSNNSGIISAPSALTINATAYSFPGGNNISCNGSSDGSISLLMNGGNAPYTYSWSNGKTTNNISNLSAGNYSVSVLDANLCSTNLSNIQLTQAAVLSSVANSLLHNGTNISCKGGSDGDISMVSIGGSKPYAYSMNGGAYQSTAIFKGLKAGTYILSAKDTNGCISTNQINLTEPANFPSASITSNGSATLCPGDSVILSTSAASSYLWSNSKSTQSIVVKSSGFYSVTTKDANGCQANSSSIPISLKTPSKVTISPSGPTSFCPGNYVQLTASPALTYQWSNGSSSQSIIASYGGLYTVTAHDTSVCAGKASILINIFPAPSIPIITQNGNMLSSSAANGYQWYFNGSPISGATNQTYQINTSGNYVVTITDINTCSNSSSSMYVIVTGIENHNFLESNYIYPNPFTDGFSLVYNLESNSHVRIEIYGLQSDLLKVLLDANQKAGEYHFTPENFSTEIPQGVYIVKMNLGGRKHILKAVKIH